VDWTIIQPIIFPLLAVWAAAVVVVVVVVVTVVTVVT
jgi:hypothetical protein